MSTDTLHLLLIEDDEADTEFIRLLLQRHSPQIAMTAAQSAAEALAILRREPGYAPLPSPNLILLDLRLPGLSGFEFLNELRRDPQLRHNIVFALSASAGAADRRLAYEYQIAGYLHKDTLIRNGAAFCRLLEAYQQTVVFLKKPPTDSWLPRLSAPHHRTLSGLEKKDTAERRSLDRARERTPSQYQTALDATRR